MNIHTFSLFTPYAPRKHQETGFLVFAGGPERDQ